MRLPGPVLVACLAASPAFAQREAVSPALSPEMAAGAFQDAVTSACIPAVSYSRGWDGLAPTVQARLEPSSDAATRRQIGAEADEAVFDVAEAKGVVFIRQKPGRCTVSVYGPPAMATIMNLAGLLKGAPHSFESLVQAPPPNGFGQSLMKVDGGKRVMIQIRGSEPGMTGHQSGFTVITATVFATPAG